MEKFCKHHGLTIFVEREGGKRFRCKKCAVDSVNKRRNTIKIKAVEYKGGCCEKCGYNKSLAALEFHHLDANKKDFAISTKGYTQSWNKVQEELDKCILVCANCHREIHDELIGK